MSFNIGLGTGYVLANGNQCPEDGGSRFLWNIGSCLSNEV